MLWLVADAGGGKDRLGEPDASPAAHRPAVGPLVARGGRDAVPGSRLARPRSARARDGRAGGYRAGHRGGPAQDRKIARFNGDDAAPAGDDRRGDRPVGWRSRRPREYVEGG